MTRWNCKYVNMFWLVSIYDKSPSSSCNMNVANRIINFNSSCWKLGEWYNFYTDACDFEMDVTFAWLIFNMLRYFHYTQTDCLYCRFNSLTDFCHLTAAIHKAILVVLIHQEQRFNLKIIAMQIECKLFMLPFFFFVKFLIDFSSLSIFVFEERETTWKEIMEMWRDSCQYLRLLTTICRKNEMILVERY